MAPRQSALIEGNIGRSANSLTVRALAGAGATGANWADRASLGRRNKTPIKIRKLALAKHTVMSLPGHSRTESSKESRAKPRAMSAGVFQSSAETNCAETHAAVGPPNKSTTVTSDLLRESPVPGNERNLCTLSGGR